MERGGLSASYKGLERLRLQTFPRPIGLEDGSWGPSVGTSRDYRYSKLSFMVTPSTREVSGRPLDFVEG